MRIWDWALKWKVPKEAVFELLALMKSTDDRPNPQVRVDSEAYAQQTIRTLAAESGSRLWRNNVGALYTDEGRFVRYGLCNESKQMNQRIKSSDLIGIRPVTIVAEHVGTIIGQFVAREVKKPSWSYKGTKREKAQLKFIELVLSLGGDAEFTRGEWK